MSGNILDTGDDPFFDIEEHSRERVRFKMATEYVVAARVMGNNANDVENIRKAGYRDEREYWKAAMSRPMKALSFAYFLIGFHIRAESDHPVSS